MDIQFYIIVNIAVNLRNRDADKGTAVRPYGMPGPDAVYFTHDLRLNQDSWMLLEKRIVTHYSSLQLHLISSCYTISQASI